MKPNLARAERLWEAAERPLNGKPYSYAARCQSLAQWALSGEKPSMYSLGQYRVASKASK